MPSLDLARGGDISRLLTQVAQDPGSHNGNNKLPSPLTGLELYRAVEARAIASRAPLLPGALVSPTLTQIHGRMQYIMAEGLQKKLGTMATTTSASREIPWASAAQFLHRELSIINAMHILAVARSRDTFASYGPPKVLSWHLAGGCIKR